MVDVQNAPARSERTTPLRLRWAVALWLPSAAAITIAAALAYGVGQHVMRSSADDPQIQVSEDAAARLSEGADPQSVSAGRTVDLATSLALAVIVVDQDGTVLASNGTLDGHPTRPPLGALDAAREHQNIVTWQPRPGVRLATVVTPWSTADRSGTVVATRSLRVVEHRENQLVEIVGLGWVAGLAATAVVAFLAAWVIPRR